MPPERGDLPDEVRRHAREADQDQIDRDDVVQQARREKDQNTRDQRDQRLQHPHIDHHGPLPLELADREKRPAKDREAVIILGPARELATYPGRFLS